MASAATTTQQPALTRGKAILIGVLGVVLLTVVFVQFRRFSGGEAAAELDLSVPSRAPRVDAAKTAGTKPATPTAVAHRVTKPATHAFDPSKWKTPDLSAVIAYDPFALPAAFPQPPQIMGASGLDAAISDGLTAEEQSKRLADALEELRMQLEELKQRGVHVILGTDGQYVATIGDRRIQVGDDINGFTVTRIDPADGVWVEWKEPE